MSESTQIASASPLRKPTAAAAARYHGALVTLHWVVAILIVAALFLGARGLAHIPNADPLKIAALRAHMAGGLIILTLMCIRLVVRSVTKRPPPASTGSVALDSIAWFSHRALYLAAIAMPVTGLIMAVQSGVIGVLLRKAIVVPADFWVYPIRSVHYVLSRTLMVLIAVHISGALYHTIIRRDGLLKRMSLRLRRAGPS